MGVCVNQRIRRPTSRSGLKEIESIPIRCGEMGINSGFVVFLTIGASCLAADPLPDKEMGEVLAAHNMERERAGTPPLSWSTSLAQVAQDWAAYLLSTNEFVHRTRSPYGENLFAVTGGKFLPSQVVARWIDEAKHYDRSTNECLNGAVCGHFTQVISGSTEEIGCGVARNAWREVWVCNYNPPGNWRGRSPFQRSVAQL